MEMEDARRAAALAEVAAVWGKTPMQTEDQAANPGQANAAPHTDRRESVEEVDGRSSKWHRPQTKGRPGKGNPGQRQWWNQEWETSQETSGTGLDSATVALMKAVTKMALRHEEELSRYRVDTNFMMFIDVGGEHSVLPTLQQAANAWQEAFSAGTVTMSLRVVLFVGMIRRLQELLQDLMQNQERVHRLMAVGWLQQGATGLNPVWPYFRWDAATQKQVTSDQQPMPHDRVLRHVETLIRTASNPLVLLGRAVHGVDQPERHPSRRVPRRPAGTVPQQCLEAFGFAPAARTPPQRAHGGSGGGGLSGDAMDRFAGVAEL